MLGIGLNLIRPRFGTATTLSVNPIPALSPMMWLDASALEGFADEDVVDLVPDSSGNGNDATQGTFMQMPLYRLAGIGGKPALQFDGIDDYLQTSLTLSQPLTIVAVIKLSAIGSVAALYDGATSRVHQYHENSAAGWRLYAGGFGDSVITPTTNREIHTAVFSGVASSLTVNGVRTGALNSGTNAIGNLRIGTNVDANSAWLNGLVGDLVVFGKALSTEEGAEVEAYLARKYGITLP